MEYTWKVSALHHPEFDLKFWLIFVKNLLFRNNVWQHQKVSGEIREHLEDGGVFLAECHHIPFSIEQVHKPF